MTRHKPKKSPWAGAFDEIDAAKAQGLDWDAAEKTLRRWIEEYEAIGPAGQLALMTALYPMRARFNGGERTQDLYDEIMQIQ